MDLVHALEQAADCAVKSMSVLHDDRVEEQLTFAEIYQAAGRVGAALVRLGAVPGERIAIALPNSCTFARAFFGILCAGGVAVPLPPPYRFASVDIHFRRIDLALRQSGVRFLLSDSAMDGILRPALASINNRIQVLNVDELEDRHCVYANVDECDTAVVQYTSGTSGAPKGVVLTHSNIVANITAISHSVGQSASDIVCGWVPLFHDMGLIAHMLLPILRHINFFLMRPEDFLLRPINWLRAISEHRATFAGAPSSAFAHCLRHVSDDEVADLDLSCWRVAINGAEAIDMRVLREFARRFEPAGFRINSFWPGYGLAEATLGVAAPPLGRMPRTLWVSRESLGQGQVHVTTESSTSRELVSVGKPLPGTEIRLVNAQKMTPVAADRVGELQVRGKSVSGRYEQPGLSGSIQNDGWVSTGDLAVVHDDELFIVGRTKEVIAILGQKFYASDIEACIASVPGIPSRGVLATSMPDAEGDEGALVVFIEMSDPTSEGRGALESSIRRAVSESHGITPKEIFFVPKGRIERTSSGKFRREGIETLTREYLIN
jgi:fatty-acyl-CoA synthase